MGGMSGDHVGQGSGRRTPGWRRRRRLPRRSLGPSSLTRSLPPRTARWARPGPRGCPPCPPQPAGLRLPAGFPPASACGWAVTRRRLGRPGHPPARPGEAPGPARPVAAGGSPGRGGRQAGSPGLGQGSKTILERI